MPYLSIPPSQKGLTAETRRSHEEVGGEQGIGQGRNKLKHLPSADGGPAVRKGQEPKIANRTDKKKIEKVGKKDNEKSDERRSDAGHPSGGTVNLGNFTGNGGGIGDNQKTKFAFSKAFVGRYETKKTLTCRYRKGKWVSRLIGLLSEEKDNKQHRDEE